MSFELIPLLGLIISGIMLFNALATRFSVPSQLERVKAQIETARLFGELDEAVGLLDKDAGVSYRDDALVSLKKDLENLHLFSAISFMELAWTFAGGGALGMLLYGFAITRDNPVFELILFLLALVSFMAIPVGYVMYVRKNFNSKAKELSDNERTLLLGLDQPKSEDASQTSKDVAADSSRSTEIDRDVDENEDEEQDKNKF